MSNFFIGIITGLISGWIVASYYRSKEKEEQWLKELFFDKQNLSRFAELLSLELDILRSELKNGVEPMQEEINNILKNIIKRPQFPSFDEKRLPQWAQEIALNYNEVFKCHCCLIIPNAIIEAPEVPLVFFPAYEFLCYPGIVLTGI